MLRFGDHLVVSVTDLTKGAQCEYALLCDLDVLLDRVPKPDRAEDQFQRRAGRLGEDHETRVLARLREHATRVEVLETDYGSQEGLRAAHAKTVDALLGGADVVYQASFYDGRLHGRADFLLRTDDGYAVIDSKLARHAKVAALLQLAAYADQAQRAEVPVAPRVGLFLGDGSEAWYRLADLLPVYRDRRRKVQALLDHHYRADHPVSWGAEGVRTCGRCPACVDALAANRDVLLVAGLRMSQRERLRSHGITTIEQLATSTEPVPGIGRITLASLRDQARLQVGQDSRPPLPDGRPDVHAELLDPLPIQRLPLPDAGDIAFDFEGDPLWSDGDHSDWGLEYLFGVVEADSGTFRPFWAHDRAEERQALRAFLDYLAQRRLAHPNLHVYHYGSYEKSALQRLASRHAEGEDEVDDLLRAGVLVDLFAVARQSIRVSQPSYSIKKLEPLYMDELRGDVEDALDSVVRYAQACDLGAVDDAARRAALLEEIADYNEYDCVSTLRLSDWLRERVAGLPDPDTPVAPTEAPETVDEALAHRRALAAALLVDVPDDDRAHRSPEQQGRAMLAAAMEYHRREVRPFWWAHFDRLQQPMDEWAATRDVFLVSEGRVVRDWYKEGKKRKLRREVELVGEWGPGTSAVASRAYTVYNPPLPSGMRPPGGCLRSAQHVTVLNRNGLDGEPLLVEELLPDDVDAFDTLPIAITPSAPPPAKHIEAAIAALTAQVVQRGWLHQPALDLLLRCPPRVTGDLSPLPDDETGAIETLASVLRCLDRSTLAVQGPPGTGKTYLGARVVRDLVRSGWRVGVVAQSHAVVEHFLNETVDAGLNPDVVGKSKAVGGTGWRQLAGEEVAAFLSSHADTGCLLGGTAWDFCHPDRVRPGLLDLLVVDEAGQFAVANTIAVSVAAQRLLLLGDPQQLPQVSQGTHPEPVETSALGWLLDGAAAMPEGMGYFLPHSWRMHPLLCERVSRLSYDDRLGSETDVTTRRQLEGIDPGMHLIEVMHLGNAQSSPEEAAEVVRLIGDLLGRPWISGRGAPPRPLGTDDVLVVAAYNAQVLLLRRTLETAGLSGVMVGTVDKLQGQEAAVVIVSMAASSSEDVPRGMEFLLSRNRVNVAISRGQWASFVVRSPLLTDYLPGTPERLAELGGFLGVTE